MKNIKDLIRNINNIYLSIMEAHEVVLSDIHVNSDTIILETNEIIDLRYPG